ncbi:4-alpha-glucanotransferase, partial [Cetobacterium sp.]|uniref:4-alpha-glucanotransferase n=1 Tax=Cetobacterium sp. TaxID=2071632 RepID=UPI003F398F73
IIAEDLGFTTPRVRKLLKESGYPGMKIFQFAFGEDESNDNLPCNVKKNTVVYTGTHDNQTFLAWYNSAPQHERKFCCEYMSKYLNKDIEKIEKDPVYSAIETLWKSDGIFSIVPLQDLLRLGTEGRMNTPSTLGGNWDWRINKNLESLELEEFLKRITQKYRG